MLHTSEQRRANVIPPIEYQHWANVYPMSQNHKRWPDVVPMSNVANVGPMLGQRQLSVILKECVF